MDTDITPSPPEPKPKRKMGRPKWMPPNLNQVRALKAQGLSNESIAHLLGISHQTLYMRKRDYAEFADALKKGLADEELVVTNALHERIKAGDNACIIWRTKTHPNMRWREATDVNMNVSGQMEIDSPQSQDTANYKRLIEVATPEERDEFAILLAKWRRRLENGDEAKPAIETSSTASEPDIRTPAITYDYDDEDED